MEKRIENSAILKIIAYILLFVFVILTGYSALGYIAYKEMPEIATNKPYYETQAFADTFETHIAINMSRLDSFIQNYQDYQEEVQAVDQETISESSVLEDYTYFHSQEQSYLEKIQNGEILYESLYSNMGASFRYLIIKDNLKITNIPKTTTNIFK